MSDLPTLPQDASLLADLTKPTTFYLKRISLLQGSSDPVKLKKPKYRDADGKERSPEAGQFMLGWGDQAQIIPGEFRAVVGPFRPHALYLVNKEVEVETFTLDDDFRRVEKLEQQLKNASSKEKQSKAAMAGVDFLFYLPDYSCFAVYFFNKTARERAKGLGNWKSSLCVVDAEFIPSKKFGGWYKPRISEPLAEHDVRISIPEAEHKEALNAFVQGGGGGGEEPEGDVVDLSPPR